MSADDPKRRRSRRRTEPPSDDDPFAAAARDASAVPPASAQEDPPEGGGAFFRAPTRAFQALPTEVLDVGSGSERPRHVPREMGSDELFSDDTSSGESREERVSDDERRRGVDRSELRTRATRLPPSLFESLGNKPRALERKRAAATGDFASTPPTEALDSDEVRRLVERHAAFPEHETEHLDLTNPDPFHVDLDSDERALFDVAREPTHHDLFLEHGDGPPSETSTDVVVPKPVSGMQAMTARSDDGFEDNTVALDAVRTPSRGGAPLLDATDEDAALPSDPPSLELPAPVPPAMPPQDDAQDRYYSELRDVIGAARVFDPKRPAHLVTDPGLREHSDDEWPEITLDPAPRPAPPRRNRFSFGLLAFLLSVLVVTVGGVGIGFGLSKRGIRLDELVTAWSLVGSVAEQALEGGRAEPPVRDAHPERADDDTQVGDARAKGAAGPWKDRKVVVYFSNVDDASKSGVSGLDETLLKAFTSALASDERARWTVASSRPQGGYGFDLSLAVLSVDDLDDGGARVRCALNAVRHHGPRGRVEASVSADRRAEGSLKAADDAKLAREASRACGFALALEFFTRALPD